MAPFACFVFLLVGMTAEPVDDWNTYKSKFGKRYSTASEEAVRHGIWEGNLDYINRHNQDADKGIYSYRLKVNRFSDETREEFVENRMSFKKQKRTPRRDSNVFKGGDMENIPTEVDWRAEGYVTPVRDQGNCGSCYAFSAVGSLEGQHFKATGILSPLSVQNIVDCSTRPDGNFGCNGGFMTGVFEYVQRKGIEKEEDYPYIARKHGCKFDEDKVEVKVSDYREIDFENEAALQEAVATVGPVSVAIYASAPDFQYYSEGVYDDPECTSDWEAINHAVLVVGYGVSDGKEYWLVKNSWGTDWGEEGYVKIARNKNNHCGIASLASFPLIENK